MKNINHVALGVILDGLLNRLDKPDEEIPNKNGIYLRRWWIVKDKEVNGNVYLHEFIGNDDDRALHDHPWPSVSLVLKGKYIEHLPNNKILRREGDVIFRDPDTPHRIELCGSPAWTLFITGPKCQEWGFHCQDGWKHHLQFIEDGGC